MTMRLSQASIDDATTTGFTDHVAASHAPAVCMTLSASPMMPM